VFTARYALSPYIKQIRFIFKGLIYGSPEVLSSQNVVCDIWDFALAHVIDITSCHFFCKFYWFLYPMIRNIGTRIAVIFLYFPSMGQHVQRITVSPLRKTQGQIGKVYIFLFAIFFVLQESLLKRIKTDLTIYSSRVWLQNHTLV
jgi:hypothetical protein